MWRRRLSSWATAAFSLSIDRTVKLFSFWRLISSQAFVLPNWSECSSWPLVTHDVAGKHHFTAASATSSRNNERQQTLAKTLSFTLSHSCLSEMLLLQEDFRFQVTALSLIHFIQCRDTHASGVRVHGLSPIRCRSYARKNKANRCNNLKTPRNSSHETG